MKKASASGAISTMRTAGRLEKVVDRAMRLNPIVLLVLSENSVKSDWVEHEARKRERVGEGTRAGCAVSGGAG